MHNPPFLGIAARFLLTTSFALFAAACSDPAESNAIAPLPTTEGFSEPGVRLIMLDVTLAGTYAYFDAHRDEADPHEALQRWDNGVRVTNEAEFERKMVGGEWRHTYRGTNTRVNGMDVRLTTD